MSKDDFAEILIIFRRGLLLICAGLEKWLKKNGFQI